jgi:hypothetical protein
MGKNKIKTVPIHARIAASDVAEIDKAADEQPISVSRSMMVALIVRDWAKRRQLKPRK